MHALLQKLHDARDYDAKDTKEFNTVANEIFGVIGVNPQEWINEIVTAREETKDEIRRVTNLWNETRLEVKVYGTPESKARAWDTYWDYFHARIFQLKITELENRAFDVRDGRI